jgi:hypothetical protein
MTHKLKLVSLYVLFAVATGCGKNSDFQPPTATNKRTENAFTKLGGMTLVNDPKALAIWFSKDGSFQMKGYKPTPNGTVWSWGTGTYEMIDDETCTVTLDLTMTVPGKIETSETHTAVATITPSGKVEFDGVHYKSMVGNERMYWITKTATWGRPQ